MKEKILNYLLIILAIIGIVISVELIFVYFKANFISGAAPSFCSINSVIDCDAVAKTQYSTFLSIPLAVYGLFFYFAVLILGIFHSFNIKFLNELKNPKSFIFTISSIAIIVSVILSLISSTQIHKICILCYITYFINIFIFAISKSGAGFMQHYENTVKDGLNILSKPIYVVITGIIILFAGFSLYFFNTTKLFIPNNTNEFLALNTPSAQPQASTGNILGSTKPKLIIHEYTDFECPYCAISNLMLHRLAMEVKNIQIVHHDFPLGGECNPKINNTSHKNSCLAALYGRAAEKQGKKWALIDLMFENQQELSETKILQLSKSLNLNIQKLKKDAHDPIAKKLLKTDINTAIDLGINATPVYIIGIKKHEGLMPYPELKKMVLENLK